MEQALVGGLPAVFVRGTVVDGIYQPDSFRHLGWDTTDLSIELNYSAPEDYPTRLEKAEMLAVAESMK